MLQLHTILVGSFGLLGTVQVTNYRKDVTTLESMPRIFTRMLLRLENVSYGGRFDCLCLLCLEQRTLRGNLIKRCIKLKDA